MLESFQTTSATRQGSRFLRVLIGVLVLLLSGCSTLVTAPESQDGSGLPLLTSRKLSEDSVILEVGFVHVPQHAEEWRRKLWSELDEQHLSPELRRKLAANGFRCGLSGEQLPAGLRAAVDKANEERIALFDSLDGPAKPGLMHRRIQSRKGKRSEVVTSDPHPSMVVLLHDGEQVVGRTFNDSQPLVALTSFPLGDGKARINLVPEIHFGPSRQKWVGKQGAFQLDAGRANEAFNRLSIETILGPGQTLVLAASGPAKSLGGNFLTAHRDDRQEKMLLVRLAQSQYDDLFTPIHESTSTATSEELLGEADLLEALEAGFEDMSSTKPAEAVEEKAENTDGKSKDGLTIDLD